MDKDKKKKTRKHYHKEAINKRMKKKQKMERKA